MAEESDRSGGTSSGGAETASPGNSTKPKQSSTKMTFRVVGICVLVVCVLGFFFGIVPSFFMGDAANKYRQKLELEAKVNVLRATSDIQKGSQIAPANVSIDQEVQYLAPSDALTSLNQLNGAVAAQDIHSASIIRTRDVIFQPVSKQQGSSTTRANKSHVQHK